MKYLTAILLFLLLVVTIRIFVILGEIRDDKILRVTEVHHHYEYEVESYGTIKLNDKLVEVERRK